MVLTCTIKSFYPGIEKVNDGNSAISIRNTQVLYVFVTDGKQGRLPIKVILK